MINYAQDHCRKFYFDGETRQASSNPQVHVYVHRLTIDGIKNAEKPVFFILQTHTRARVSFFAEPTKNCRRLYYPPWR